MWPELGIRPQGNKKAAAPEHRLVQVLPEVLCHQAEGTEEGPAESVEVCVAVVRVIAESLKADVVLRAGTSPARVAAQLVVLHLRSPVPVGVVPVEMFPRLVALPPRTVVE
jgi:hypothetical protein